MSLLTPDRYFSRISDIDIEVDLIQAGRICLLLDMDNTILSRKTHDVPRDIVSWIARAKQGGVRLCIVSNNWHTSVHEVGKLLSIPVVGKALKPLPFGFFSGRNVIGARSSNCVVIGDQLSTDVLGAHLLGMPAWLVAPLACEEPPHTQLIRRFEQGFIDKSIPEGATCNSLPCIEDTSVPQGIHHE